MFFKRPTTGERSLAISPVALRDKNTKGTDGREFNS
jgi:hypothetical protein